MTTVPLVRPGRGWILQDTPHGFGGAAVAAPVLSLSWLLLAGLLWRAPGDVQNFELIGHRGGQGPVRVDFREPPQQDLDVTQRQRNRAALSPCEGVDGVRQSLGHHPPGVVEPGSRLGFLEALQIGAHALEGPFLVQELPEALLEPALEIALAATQCQGLGSDPALVEATPEQVLGGSSRPLSPVERTSSRCKFTRAIF